jgi:hypothetical protein
MAQRRLRLFALALAWTLASATPKPRESRPIGPAPETLQAFERYIQLAEARQEPLLVGAPAYRRQLRAGEILCRPRRNRGDLKAPKGLIHDWVGAVFIPQARLSDVLAVVRDYDHHARIYHPDVVVSRTVSHQGDRYTVFLRLLKRKGIAVVLDTEHDIEYRRLDDNRWQSRSRTTRVAELENAGTERERTLPPGRDHGFLWRLNSYWHFEQADGGVYVECEAISLSRAVPSSLAWLIDPIVRRLPRESLLSTLAATRKAVAR